MSVLSQRRECTPAFQLHLTFRIVQHLKSDSVTDLPPGTWSQRPSEEIYCH
ncbi:hypothetical protein J6590_016356 [Homalodisca vitripennis]|nr:hypothetical protein J6590_016356 [Homalodisca vitripennis]